MITQKDILEFLSLANKFRSTPIVDDDFCLMRDRFDFKLNDLLAQSKQPFPKIVCLCGSTRFGDAYRDALRSETLDGNIVLSVGLLGHAEGIDMNGPIKTMLDQLHMRKIDLCDEVLVLNVKVLSCHKCHKPCESTYHPTGGGGYSNSKCCLADTILIPYIGSSTRNEINYAIKIDKPIRYLNLLKEKGE